MKKLLLFFGSLMIFHSLVAQFNSDPISNITWEEDRIREEVIIMYDLEGNQKYDFYDITVQLYNNENIIKLNMDNLSNNKKVTAGIGLKIRWLVPEEYIGLPSNTSFRLIAKGILKKEIKKRNIPYVLLGLGLGSVAYGVIKMIPAKQNYDDNYVPRTNPDDPFYWSDKQTTRSAYYNDVNKEYQNGRLFVASGIGLTVAGALLNFRVRREKNQVNRKEKRQKLNRKQKRKFNKSTN